ncbi:hypothetical protein LLG39_12425 [bacterium]|nr:hypothetical protein [bacterium]
MELRRLHFFILMILILALCAPVRCAQIVMGTLVTSPGNSDSIQLRTESDTLLVQVSKTAKIKRGQVGVNTRSVSLRDLAPGDQVTAWVSRDGVAGSVEALFGVVTGNVKTTKNGKLVLSDGRYVAMSSRVQIVSSDGKLGKINDIKTGMLVKCRVNPVTNQAWTVFAAVPDKKTIVVKPAPKKLAKPVVQKTSAVEKPKVTSVTYSSPSPLKAGDLLTVDIAATPGGKAMFEVDNLISATQMIEVSPGSYRAVVTVPKGKTVTGAPLLAYVMSKGIKSAAVQASRLVTVATEVAKQQVVSAPAPKPVPAPPAPQVTIPVVDQQKAPEPQPVRDKIILMYPADGAKISRALLIKGTAQPDSKVMVTVTFSNGLSGLLKLSGSVASQLVAVGKNGVFTMGPVALEGPLATQSLQFTIKVYYPDQDDHSTVTVNVFGARN